MLFAGKLMEMESVMLSETSQSHKDKHVMFSLICGSEGNNTKPKVMEVKEGQRGDEREGKRGKRGLRK
jgi:hypothetical protein